MVRNRTRRDVLRTGTGALAAVGMAGLAGCSGGIPGFGGSNHTEWLHEPGEIRDTDHYSFLHMDSADFLDNESELSDEMFKFAEEYVEDYSDHAGMDFDETSWLITGNVATVVGSTFSKEEMIDELENDGYNDETDHEGYTVLGPDSDDRSGAMAVNGDHLIAVADVQDPVGVAEDIIDVGIGDGNRYVDENDTMSKLTDELGDESVIYGNTREPAEKTDTENGQFKGMTGAALAASINGERTARKWVLVFEDADEVDTGDVEDWISENDGSDERFDDVENVNVSKSGRAAVVTGKMDSDDLTFF